MHCIVCTHTIVLIDPELGTQGVGNEPIGDTVAGISGRSVRNIGTTRHTNLCEDACNIGFRKRDQKGRSTNLAHGRDNKVCIDVLHHDALTLDFLCQSLCPCRKESLATRVH